MTEPNLAQATEAFVQYVVESNSFQDEAVTRREAYAVAAQIDTVAQKFFSAIQEMQIVLSHMDYVGEPVSDTEELARIVFDHIQDEVGHKASDVLRAAVKGR